MTDRDKLFLDHILDAIGEIASYTTAGRAGFIADRKTQSAIIRQLEIIGEAVKNLSAPLTGAAPSVPWRQIAGTRDRLIHAYFNVDLDAVWSMIEQDLPELRVNVLRIVSDRTKPRRREMPGAWSRRPGCFLAPARHRITSSARNNSAWGTARPSALAVRRFNTNR